MLTAVKPTPIPLVGLPTSSRTAVTKNKRSPHICRSSWTSGVLQNIAKLALQSQLKRYDLVDVVIDSAPGRLLEGTVDGVVVKGQGWQSPLGLSARLLEVSAGMSQLDIPRTLQTQNVQLKNVPTGYGRVRFTNDDFRNFMRHPLMEAALQTAVQGGSSKGVIAADLMEFFSDLTLELKGAFFTFSEMRIGRLASTKEPVVDLKVAVRVEEFPPLNQISF